MEYKIHKPEDYTTSRWTGGTTTQLAIYPEDASYLDRNFVWRLSSAVCEKDETTFSKLPDYDRTLIVLSGSVILAHEDVRVCQLAELEQDSFPGDYKTKSFGQITDYNLMVRKGNRGTAEVLKLSTESTPLTLTRDEEYPMAAQTFYIRDGFATVSLNGKTLMLMGGQQLVICYDQREEVALSIMGEGTAVWCQIFYHYEVGDLGPVKIEARPASFADFKECMYIANTQYRFSKYIHKRLKNIWYDEELQKGINKINRFYLSDIIYMIGLCVLLFVGVAKFTPKMWIIAIAVWTILYLVLFSPLLYFLVVPKPVAAHIKDVDKLTPYERAVREHQLNTNERVERIMKRYKYSGTAQYDEEGKRIDDLKSKMF